VSQMVTLRLGLEGVDRLIGGLIEHDIPHKVAQRVASLWGPEATSEASIRLGWTSDPREMNGLVEQLLSLRDSLRHDGVKRVILCGMGGSSLAPEVMAKRDGVPLDIVDSTHPDQVARSLLSDLSDAVVVVSSKSGTTVETATARASFEAGFTQIGLDPRTRVIIVTDPDSPLHKEASEAEHTVFLADPQVGGRFSALTAFGLVPTTLAGVDTRAVIAEAASVWEELRQSSESNPAVLLGSALSLPHRDIALLVSNDDQLPGLGDWIEQLVAESTGKNGKGILPVVASSNAPELSGRMDDVVSISLSKSASQAADVTITASLGAQFLLWEYATAFCGYLRQLNPFDQPDVESAKVAARGLLDRQPAAKAPDVRVDGVEMWLSPGFSGTISSPAEAWQVVSDSIGPSGYLGVHLYCDRLAHPHMDEVRNALVSRMSRPVTIGFGPRFLHSTGQFHKGGTPDGVFVQVVVQPRHDLQIPGYPFDFATLVNAQALGDRDVLVSRGRPVLTVRVPDEASLEEFLVAGGRFQ